MNGLIPYVKIRNQGPLGDEDWETLNGVVAQEVAEQTLQLDTTLTVSGKAADAKAVGDEINNDSIWETTSPTLLDNTMINNDGSLDSNTNGWKTTEFIDVSNCLNFKVSGMTYSDYRNCCFYDASGNTIGNRSSLANDTTKPIPQTAKYLRVASGNSNMNNGTISIEKITRIQLIDDRAHANAQDIEDIKDAKAITVDSLIANTLISGENGNALEAASWSATDFIELPFDETSDFYICGTFYGIGGCAIYDADKTKILGINGSNVADYGGVSSTSLQKIKIPYQEGMRYARISGYTSQISEPSDLYAEGNTIAGAFKRITALEENVKTIGANVSTTIAESKVLVIGDSISTDAYGSYPKWVTVLKNQGFFPSDTTNSSQHATGFVARYDNQPNDFITRLKAIQNPSQYDLVVVFGGINDYIQNVPMGSETGTDYTVSFKPAVNEFFDYLIQNFTQARLCVLLPLRNYQNWQNSVGEYQQSYAEYIKTVAKKYCLPVLNLTEDSGFCPYISTFSDMWTLIPQGYQSGDGTHPNEDYEAKYLAPMIKGFLQGLM